METEEWLDFWPGNEHLAPELTLMRSGGPLSTFVEFLIDQARPESYIEAAEDSRSLDMLERANLVIYYGEYDSEPLSEEENEKEENAEAELQSLEEEEEELYRRVSRKFDSHQAREYQKTLKQISTKPFLKKTKFLDLIEACHSSTARLQKRLTTFSAVPWKPLCCLHFENLVQTLRNSKTLFMDTIRASMNGDTPEDSSRLSRKPDVCQSLKRCTKINSAKFWSWWAEDLKADVAYVNKTTVENTTLEHTVKSMNESFSSKISIWTKIHGRIGIGNLEIESQLQEVDQRRTSDSSVGIALLELNNMEYCSLLLDHLRQLDVDEFIEELDAISKETTSPNTSFLPDNSEFQREIDVEFICALLKTWPVLTFQLLDIMDYGNLALKAMNSSGQHILRAIQRMLDFVTSEEIKTFRRDLDLRRVNKNTNKKSKSLPNRLETKV